MTFRNHLIGSDRKGLPLHGFGCAINYSEQVLNPVYHLPPAVLHVRNRQLLPVYKCGPHAKNVKSMSIASKTFYKPRIYKAYI